MKAKLISGIVLIACCAGLAGCATTPKEEPKETAYLPVSDRPPTASEHWFRRDQEDQAAVARARQLGQD